MERKEEILKLIEEGYKTAKELARHFDVSLMTIYRDLKNLEEEGLIIRKHGNVEIRREEEVKENICTVCGKDIDLRLAFIYILRGGKKVHTCCAHCGFILFKNFERERIEIALTRDFITCNPINAFGATYVIGSSASPCCNPSAIAFSERKDAERFSTGFGGLVYSFEEGIEKTKELMKAGKRVDIKIEGGL